jgi:hypothetical protein
LDKPTFAAAVRLAATTSCSCLSLSSSLYWCVRVVRETHRVYNRCLHMCVKQSASTCPHSSPFHYPSHLGPEFGSSIHPHPPIMHTHRLLKKQLTRPAACACWNGLVQKKTLRLPQPHHAAVGTYASNCVVARGMPRASLPLSLVSRRLFHTFLSALTTLS